MVYRVWTQMPGGGDKIKKEGGAAGRFPPESGRAEGCCHQRNGRFRYICAVGSGCLPEYMEIGHRIRDLRKRQGLTQEELADRAELSKGFISQLERDMTSPSIATLEDILQCLGTSIGEFFAQEQVQEQIVFTEKDYFVKEDRECGNRIQWIIPNAQKNSMEPICLHLEAGGSTYPDNPHEGEEFGYVLKGRIVIHLGKETHTAKKGDSFYYTADRTHYIFSERGADILWVTSPPSF